MPFRMILDDGHAAVEDSCLIGARSLDPPEQEFIADQPVWPRSWGSLEGVAGAYIAFDCDVLDPGQIDCFMPEPDGISLDDGRGHRGAGRVADDDPGDGADGPGREPREPGSPAATAGRCGPRLSGGGLGLPVRVGGFRTLRGV